MSDGAAKAVPMPTSVDQTSGAGMYDCLTFAASRDRVPVRCGMASIPTPSQGRAGAILKRCAERLLPLAQRALAVALTDVGELAGPHRRRAIGPGSMMGAITVHDLYTLPY